MASPSIEAITTFTRDQLVVIAGHYKIEVAGSLTKADMLEVITDHPVLAHKTSQSSVVYYFFPKCVPFPVGRVTN